jgi:PAS domain S-box-containing protein
LFLLVNMSINKPYIWRSADKRLITTEQVNTIIGLGALFEYATEGILVTDSLGNIVMINPAAELMFGYEKGELAGKKIEILIPHRLSHYHEKVREGYNKKPEPRSMGVGRDLFAAKKDGTEFPVEISLSPFESENGKFVIAFVIDIAVRKESEAALNRQREELVRVSSQIKQLNVELERKVEDRTTMLRETLAQLERSKNELSESLQKEKELGDLKSRFVSTVSHEFRTPLGAILSSAYLLEKYIQKNELDKTERHLVKITESVRHMNAMLEELLSLGKLEEGLIQAKSEEFDFKMFMTDLVNEMQELARKGQKIKLDLTNTDRLSADKRLLKNVLLNLVSNAIKFSEENEIIQINCNSHEDRITIAVIDSGIGISKADQEHLFERFFRAQNASNIQGTGLGLHIVSKYLELLDGTIDIKSEPGKGSTFSITIPTK